MSNIMIGYRDRLKGFTEEIEYLALEIKESPDQIEREQIAEIQSLSHRIAGSAYRIAETMINHRIKSNA